MPVGLIRTPEQRCAAGELAAFSVPVTPTGSVALFASFALYVWEDPEYEREGAAAGDPIDPIAGGWPLAATLTGTPATDTVTFAGTLPSAAGERRYVFSAWGLGGTAGPACLIYPTWLTLVPGRPV
jgi:hypothetical protein